MIVIGHIILKPVALSDPLRKARFSITSRMILLISVLVFAVFLPPGFSRALEKLPSALGPHIMKIRALEDGEWLNLGIPRADPVWGQARGRSWCQKMNFAPDLRAAYYTGEGRHAFVKPDGHYMDDHFLYDINAHAWICLYPGAKAGKDQGLRLSKTGLLVNKQGEPIPSGLLAHNYDQTTYDVHQKKFAFIPKGGSTGWWITMKCEQVKALAKPAQEKMKSHEWSPWYFSVETGKFEREIIHSKGPSGTHGAGCFMYLKKHKKFFLRDTITMKNWIYDPESKSWKKAGDLPRGIATGFDSVSCYDSKRGLLYMAGGSSKEANGNFVAYDLEKDAWTVLPLMPHKNWFTGNSGTMTYDTANDIVVAKGSNYEPFLFFNPREGRWQQDEQITKTDAVTGFYDSENNVHYYFQAGDSMENGVMWVYRYKQAGQ